MENEKRYLIPDWEGSVFQKWAKSFCSRNQWRVQRVLGSYEDCMAKCALGYVICSHNYGATVNSPQHFMYLFKLWVTCEFNTLSVNDTHNRELHANIREEEPAIDSDAQLAVKLNSASSELKEVLTVIFNGPQEILDVIKKDASSCHPKQFFRAVVEFCGISKSKSATLAKELQELLSK